MSTAESLPPTPDASSGEPTSKNPRFPEGGWALYAVNGDGETTPSDAIAPDHDDVIKKMDADTVGEAEVASDRTGEAGSLDKPETDPSAEESGGKGQDDGTAEGGDDETEQKTAPSSPNMTRRLAIKIGAGVAAAVTGIVGIVAATSNHAESPTPAPTIAGPKTPGPGATETASSQPTATETTEQGDNLKELGLPSIEEFQNMTLKEQEAAIEEALPESLLSDPEMVYRRTVALEELIYNAPASDKLYKEYTDGGGIDYKGYIMDEIYDPLFQKLLGKKPSRNLADGGAFTFAYRASNVLDIRYQNIRDRGSSIMKPYSITLEAVSAEAPSSEQAPYDIRGMISMHDTIDQTQSDALLNLKHLTVNVIDQAPVDFTMFGVHYDENAGLIRASRLE